MVTESFSCFCFVSFRANTCRETPRSVPHGRLPPARTHNTTTQSFVCGLVRESTARWPPSWQTFATLSCAEEVRLLRTAVLTTVMTPCTTLQQPLRHHHQQASVHRRPQHVWRVPCLCCPHITRLLWHFCTAWRSPSFRVRLAIVTVAAHRLLARWYEPWRLRRKSNATALA